MEKSPSIRDIMTTKVYSVTPETYLMEAAQLMQEHKIGGVPVVDKDKILKGILTEYDLLTKGAKIHLPTFALLLKDFSIHKTDRTLIEEDLKNILSLKVGDVMNSDPLSLDEKATLEEAVLAFANHHRVNPIPIINADNKLVGIVSRFDVIKFYSPFKSREASEVLNERNLDYKMSAFLGAFEKKFVLVSKFRSRYWFLLSLLFILVGFILALMLLTRIVVQP